MPVYAFGSNTMSQLGLGDEARSTHVPTPVPFFDDKKVVKIRCGSLHTLALTDDGKLYSWGCNDEGALGRGGEEGEPALVSLKERVVDMDGGASISACVVEDGRAYIWGTFRSRDGVFGLTPSMRISFSPVKLPLREVAAVSAGQSFIVALSLKGIPYTFGTNGFCELGRKTSVRNKLGALIPQPVAAARNTKANHNFTRVVCGLNHAMAINTGNEVYAWGSNIYKHLGHGLAETTANKNRVPVEDVVEVAGGDAHSLFLKKSGELLAVGNNRECQLGIEGCMETGELARVNLPRVSAVRAYNTFNVAKAGNDLYSWGTGFSGALGFEKETVKTPARIPFSFPEIIDFDVGNDFTMVATK
jgi:regulator of chromosome condensation